MNKNTIGLTSKGSAAARIYESKRTNPLFNDPFASVYAGHFGIHFHTNTSNNEDKTDVNNSEQTCRWSKISLRKTVANLSLHSASFLRFGIPCFSWLNSKQIFGDVAVRTRFMDDVIQNNIMNLQQIVLLACGGDFRPYRLTFLHPKSPSAINLTFYLLDMPDVIKHRQECFGKLDPPPIAPCNIIEISCDLANDEWDQKICGADFDTKQTTLWLAEGFLEYLTEQQIKSLFNKIQHLSLSNQSHIVFDVISTRFQARYRHAISGGLFHFAVDDSNEIDRIFSEMGCHDIQSTSFEELGRRYDRNVSRDRSFVVNTQIYPADS